MHPACLTHLPACRVIAYFRQPGSPSPDAEVQLEGDTLATVAARARAQAQTQPQASQTVAQTPAPTHGTIAAACSAHAGMGRGSSSGAAAAGEQQQRNSSGAATEAFVGVGSARMQPDRRDFPLLSAVRPLCVALPMGGTGAEGSRLELEVQLHGRSLDVQVRVSHEASLYHNS